MSDQAVLRDDRTWTFEVNGPTDDFDRGHLLRISEGQRQTIVEAKRRKSKSRRR